MAPKKQKTTEVAGTSTSRGRKRTGEGIPNEIGIIFRNSDQRDRYERHEKRKVQPTRYPDFSDTYESLGLDGSRYSDIPYALKTLGIEDNVTMLLNNLGWLDFLKPARKTFYALTREFLSSLHLTDNRLSFRLFNDDFEMTVADFGERIGYPNVGVTHDARNLAFRPTGYDPIDFWNKITGEGQYEARTAKASSIHNPVFRYIARIMACTIFGRGELGGVRTGELFLLWAMVNGAQVNTCHYIIDNLLHVAKQKTGDIVVGGLVTFIIGKLGLEDRLVDFESLEGNIFIDLEACEHMHLIRAVNTARTNFHLLISKQMTIILPNPARTDTRDQNNWLYTDIAGELPREQPEQEAEIPQEDNANVHGDEGWWVEFQREQQRQGEELRVIREEQLSQSQQMGRMTDMLQSIMHHFSINQAPPPDQP